MMRVLLCTDEPLVACRLTALFAASHPFLLADICDSPASLQAAVWRHHPDLLLIDLDPAHENELLQSMRDLAPQTKIVACLRNAAAHLALPALSSGARGVIRRSAAQESLLRCLQCICEGELWFDKSLTDEILPLRILAPTAGEHRLIALVSQGLNNREIAAAAGLAQATVRAALLRLYRKLGVRDRYELALCALGLHGQTQSAAPTAPPPDSDLLAPDPVVPTPPQTLRRH